MPIKAVRITNLKKGNTMSNIPSTGRKPTIVQKTIIGSAGLPIPNTFEEAERIVQSINENQRNDKPSVSGNEATMNGAAGSKLSSNQSSEVSGPKPPKTDNDNEKPLSEKLRDMLNGEQTKPGNYQSNQSSQSPQPRQGLAALKPEMGERQNMTAAMKQKLDQLLADSGYLKELIKRILNEDQDTFLEAMGAPDAIQEAIDPRVAAIREIANTVGSTIRREVEQIRAELGITFVLQRELDGEMFATEVNGTHFQFPQLVKRVVQERLTVYMQGPSQSGKTTAAQQLAKLLNLPFYYLAGSAQMSMSHLKGFISPHDNSFQHTAFSRAYIEGGVALLDELDGWHEQVLISGNAAIANKVCDFPHGVFEMHPDCYIIAAGNTAMTGPDRAYKGRRAQDAATRQRWVKLDWPYDPELERRMAGFDPFGWREYVVAVREAAKSSKMEELIFSPTQTKNGLQLLRADTPWRDVENDVLFWGIDAQSCQELKMKATTALNVGRIGLDYAGKINYQEYLAIVNSQGVKGQGNQGGSNE